MPHPVGAKRVSVAPIPEPSSQVQQESAGEPRAVALHFADKRPEPIGDRASLDAPMAARSGAATDTRPKFQDPPTLLESFMQSAEPGLLDTETLTALAPMSKELDKAARTRQTEPIFHVAFAKKALLRELERKLAEASNEDRPALEQQVAVARTDFDAARLRSQAFHKKVAQLTREANEQHATLCEAINQANATGKVPENLWKLAATAHQAMSNCGQYEKAIKYAELTMAFGPMAPKIQQYVYIADDLLAAGKPELAAALMRQVVGPDSGFAPTSNSRKYALAKAQLAARDYKGALATLGVEGVSVWAMDLAAIAYYYLAEQAPEPAERDELRAKSDAAVEGCASMASSRAVELVDRATLFFAMDRVDEALACLDQAVREPAADLVLTMELIIDSPFVLQSARRKDILARPVWAEYARVTGQPNPVDMQLAREHVSLPSDLPAINVRPLHKIISVEDLKVAPVPQTGSPYESDTKR